MANLTPYLTEKYTKMITEITTDLGKTADDLVYVQNIVRGLKNPDLSMNGGSVTMDRIQIMENGDIRLLPPVPAPITETCVQAPEPEKNGKKPEKEPVKEAVKEPVNAS